MRSGYLVCTPVQQSKAASCFDHMTILTAAEQQISKSPYFADFFTGHSVKNQENAGVFKDTSKTPSHGTLKNADFCDFCTLKVPGVVA